ncbi:hypothetical protein BWK58_06970 [Flavobacterium columnare]|nr:hypothetical protein BWK58_06970 [Flavobacterium columnare]
MIPTKTYAPPNQESLDNIRTTIEAVINCTPRLVAIEVQIVSESDLFVNPTTSKTPSIVDFRN